MKNTFILIFLSLSIILACNSGSTKSFIPGTYVNHSEGAYSIADDTLIIRYEQGDHFSIQRKTGFNLIRDGKKGKREHETENWKAVYDKETGTLMEIRSGKILVFYPDSGKLLIGSRAYQKIN